MSFGFHADILDLIELARLVAVVAVEVGHAAIAAAAGIPVLVNQPVVVPSSPAKSRLRCTNRLPSRFQRLRRFTDALAGTASGDTAPRPRAEIGCRARGSSSRGFPPATSARLIVHKHVAALDANRLAGKADHAFDVGLRWLAGKVEYGHFPAARAGETRK